MTTSLPAGWPARTYLHPIEAYTSCTACTSNVAGVVFFALVMNPPGGIDTQYCVVVRYANKVVTEIKRLTAKESRAYALANGASSNKVNGKFGNVSIAVSGLDLVLGLEIRTESINTGVVVILTGLAK